MMCKNLVLWASDPLRNINKITSSQHPWKAPLSPAPEKKVRQRAACRCCRKKPLPRAVLGLSHCASLCTGGACQHPRTSHEWSNPFCRSTSWPKGGGSARFPVCLVLTSWPWACLGACRAKLKAGGSAGSWLLLDWELATLPSPGSSVICMAAAGDLSTWQRWQPACQIYSGLSGKVTN